MMNPSDLVTAAVQIVQSPSDGNYFGLLRALCVDNKDPLGLGRVKTYIPSINGPIQPELEAIPWASPSVPFGGSSAVGVLLLPEVGSTVWVLFEGGNTQYPVWIGAWWGLFGDAPDTPAEVYDGHGIPVNDVIYRSAQVFIYAKRDGSELRIALNNDVIITLLPESINLRVSVGEINIRDDDIVLTESGGALVNISNGVITLQSASGNTIVLSEVSCDITAPIINLNGVVNMGG